MFQLILMSLAAGAGGTALGGLFGIFFARRSSKILSYVLSFAGGVMLGIVCFSLIPEANELIGGMRTVAATIMGVALVYALHSRLDKLDSSSTRGKIPHVHVGEMNHETGLLDAVHSKKSLYRAGLVMLFAIGLHNIPEGVAIGAASIMDDKTLCVALTITLALHNIPEGMAISAPLVGGGMRLLSAVALTGAAGAMMTIGALAGMWFGNISDHATGACLAGAGGAMLYVVFGEIIPQSILLDKSRAGALIVLLGMLCGMLIGRT